MKTAALIATLVVLGLAAYANAECANACSGHGTCGTKDECTCYPNWQAADCSERTCPFGLSFVDTPQGDLNHNGAVADSSGGQAVQWSNKNTWEKYPNVDNMIFSTSTYYKAQSNEAHFYVECSNKGHCNRETGECQCFDGYEGSSCQRTKCPNDCSGHGVCRTMEEIAATNMTMRVADRLNGGDVVYTGVESAFTYTLWDKDKNQACVCDAGYSGFDCSLRECPRGDDPMTHRARDCFSTSCETEVQTVTLTCSGTDCDNDLTLHFDEWNGMTWSTSPIQVNAPTAATPVPADDSAAATAIANALTALPNGAIESVTVAASTSTNDRAFAITFTANPGNQPMLRCTLAARTGDSGTSTCTVAQTTMGNMEEQTCSNRGLCDYETGLCKCFKGFFDDDCSVQHALAV